jgi:hypothetical protein
MMDDIDLINFGIAVLMMATVVLVVWRTWPT